MPGPSATARSGCRRCRGERVPRRTVRHGEHQVGACSVRRQQPGCLRILVSWPARRPRAGLGVGSRRATYRVRPDTRTWLGAGSPSAAATNDGAAMAEPDSTAQSLKKVRIRSPRLVLKMATTSRRSGLSSWARRAAWKLPRSSWREQGQRPGRLHFGGGERAGIQVGPLDDPYPGSRAMCGPWSRCADGRITVTCSPYRGGELLDHPRRRASRRRRRRGGSGRRRAGKGATG